MPLQVNKGELLALWKQLQKLGFSRSLVSSYRGGLTDTEDYPAGELRG